MTAETIAIALGAGSTLALFVLGAAQLLLLPRARVQQRVTALQERTAYAASVDVLQPRRRLRSFEAVMRRHSWTGNTARMLERAGLPLQVGEYVMLRVVAVAVGTACGAVFGSATGGAWPLLGAASGALAGTLAPVVYVRRRIAARSRAIEPQLLELCELMASMLRSGFGYMQALTSTLDQLGPPLSTELERMVDQVRLGAGVDEALEQLNRRLGSRDFDLVATAIAIQRRSGGSLATILSGVAETIRDRQMLKLEVRALTSRERLSAIVVAGFPLLLVGVLTLMLPETFGRLLTDPIGRVVLGIALTLDAIGYVAIKRATRITV